MARQPERYTPDVAPQDVGDLARYTERELHRLAASIDGERENTVALFAEDTADVVFGPDPPTYGQLFVGRGQILGVPENAWDAATGTFTAPLAGVYRASLQLAVDDPGGSGNQQYEILGQIFTVGGESVVTVQGAADSVANHVVVVDQLLMAVGDQLQFWAALVHTQFTQAAAVRARADIVRW